MQERERKQGEEGERERQEGRDREGGREGGGKEEERERIKRGSKVVMRKSVYSNKTFWRFSRRENF